MQINILSGKNWPKADQIGWCDPMVVVKYEEDGKKKKYKTKHQNNTANPKWKDESFKINTPGDIITFVCYDWDRFDNNDLLGQCSVSIQDLKKKNQLGRMTLTITLNDKYVTKRKENCGSTLDITIQEV